MPKITKVYTRGGDDGSTGLGDGRRVPKDDLRIEASGAVDELNSEIGSALACGLEPGLERSLRGIQNELFHLGAELCFPEPIEGPKIERRHVVGLEQTIDGLTAELGPLDNFILPGGTPGAARLHVARSVCRRAERSLVALAHREPIPPLALEYVNRLSDALFVMARRENHHHGVSDTLWNSRA